MIARPMSTIRAAALVMPIKGAEMEGETPLGQVAAADTVQKPVTQPKRPTAPRTGPAPVTKGLKALPTNGHAQVHLKLDVERKAVLLALQMAQRADWAGYGDIEAEAGKRVLARLEARQ